MNVLAATFSNCHYRSVFLSDLHLGASACRANEILDFLGKIEAETIYLVGDVFDCPSRVQRRASLGVAMVVNRLKAKMAAGQRIVYIAGNHDNLSREACSRFLGSVEIVDWVVHSAADGKRYLVIHGDSFDLVTNRGVWLTLVGQKLEAGIRSINRALNHLLRAFGRGEYSIMRKVTGWMNSFVTQRPGFSELVRTSAERHAVSGIICGHFHSAEIHQDFGVVYANCGDWIDSCTAIAETTDGNLEVLSWHTQALLAVRDIREVRSNHTTAIGHLA